MITEMGKRAKQSALVMAVLDSDKKDKLLLRLADNLWEERNKILSANEMDVQSANNEGLSNALVDRLLLNEKRLSQIIDELRNVAGLEDPVGEVFDQKVLENGLIVHKVRVPIGVLAVIYEARPNVTLDVTGLALKTGNCIILRGGSETIHTNIELIKQIRATLVANQLPADSVQFIDSPDRGLVAELLRMHDSIDMLIPRGGEELHRFCRENSSIPVITGGIGICHLFVDNPVNIESAIDVILNAKIQRPTVCNALDTVLVHEDIASKILPLLVNSLSASGVSFRFEKIALEILQKYNDKNIEKVIGAGPGDFDTEWLSLILGVKVVKDLAEAIDHIQEHSTGHSDGILTDNPENAKRFISIVDSAAVYINASTRFTDGAQLGMGAEVAISTQRLHARGPMGLKELTTYKWVIQGEYSIRP